ncbi:MAG: hypothetical protein WCG26_11500 [Chloroflexales bacterium]
MTYPYMPAPSGTSAIREWATLVTQFRTSAETLLDSLNRPLRLWERNKLADLTAACAPGALVGDSGLTKEAVTGANVHFQGLLTWLNTPVQIGVDTEGGAVLQSPIDFLSLRS